MVWIIFYPGAFVPEMEALSETVQDGLLTMVELLTLSGPSLGRPYADTLAGSKHANMKERRFAAEGGVWRVAFAFDPKRRAIILVAGDKAGVAQKRFYKTLIAKADARFADHLETLKG